VRSTVAMSGAWALRELNVMGDEEDWSFRVFEAGDGGVAAFEFRRAGIPNMARLERTRVRSTIIRSLELIFILSHSTIHMF